MLDARDDARDRVVAVSTVTADSAIKTPMRAPDIRPIKTQHTVEMQDALQQVPRRSVAV